MLVHLYEDYGTQLVDALDGMYAFAVWDTRQRTLMLARDRFGEKPLFYCQTGSRLTFASELTALRASLGREPELDPGSLDAYLVLGYVPGERSIFRGIRALPSGSTLRWSAGERSARIDVNWRMPARPRSSSRPISEYAEEAKVLLRRAVRSRLVADVPVGVMLSGGLDSNIIAAMVAEAGVPALRTFTVSYDVGTVNEARAARETAARLGSEHHECTLTSDDVAVRVPRILAALDQPNGDPALIALHAVSELARRTVTVTLGGEGADELFGGYPRYRWIAQAERIAALLPRSLARTGAQALKLPRNRRTARLADMLAPGDIVARQIDWVATGVRPVRQGLYGARLKAHLDEDLALADAEAVYRDGFDGSPEAGLMGLDQQRYLVDDVLAKADRATMQLSLEMRSPYLSRELAEFSAGIPAPVHTSRGGKAVLRAVAGEMPEVGRNRRAKTAFRVPLSDWLRGPLASLVAELPAEGRLVRDGWIDGGELGRLIAVHQAGEQDHSSMIWTVLVAELSLGSVLA
jgi:asparagine synthase (glutamine-hydrolysing)